MVLSKRNVLLGLQRFAPRLFRLFSRTTSVASCDGPHAPNAHFLKERQQNPKLPPSTAPIALRLTTLTETKDPCPRSVRVLPVDSRHDCSQSCCRSGETVCHFRPHGAGASLRAVGVRNPRHSVKRPSSFPVMKFGQNSMRNIGCFDVHPCTHRSTMGGPGLGRSSQSVATYPAYLDAIPTKTARKKSTVMETGSEISARRYNIVSSMLTLLAHVGRSATIVVLWTTASTKAACPGFYRTGWHAPGSSDTEQPSLVER